MIEVKPGESPDKQIKDKLDRVRENLKCQIIRRYEKEVARLPIPTMIEFMTKTECHWEYNDCFSTRVCLEKPYARETFTRLYATLLYSADQDGLIRIFEKCILEAALTSAVIGLVTENFPAALIAFKALVLHCIVEHATEEIECLVPDLFLVNEVQEWHPI
ncbi:hypothetical protein [Agrobacterium tumefaciens]|uniref:hypothetical protein n=1 Tax=Agrobacterium tumefaciens TaxID=358 RepID=UPI0015721403|nr:hypothetical protein [Agrobacterium tumefaciens]WCK03292.1 hypothetical protein G6L31_005500 [Agrobacterium tumefaciens]